MLRLSRDCPDQSPCTTTAGLVAPSSRPFSTFPCSPLTVHLKLLKKRYIQLWYPRLAFLKTISFLEKKIKSIFHLSIHKWHSSTWMFHGMGPRINDEIALGSCMIPFLGTLFRISDRDCLFKYERTSSTAYFSWTFVIELDASQFWSLIGPFGQVVPSFLP